MQALAGIRTRGLRSRGKYPAPLVGFALATSAVAAPLIVGAALRLAGRSGSLRELGGVAIFFALALLAELRPVPVDLGGNHVVSLTFVFIIASQLLYSWEWSVLIGAGAMILAQLPSRVPVLKLAFNSAVYAISATAAAVPALMAHTDAKHVGYADLTGLVFAAAGIFVIVNLLLVCVAVALASGRAVRETLSDHLHHSAPAFSIMIFLAAQAVIFWRISPFLLILVGAPLFTLNLYQRSSIRGRAAQHAAITDSLTGLKNHRAYQQEIAAALAGMAELGATWTLCLVDIDQFKQVNDRHGHSVGDAVLRVLGSLMKELVPGSAYRLGGDEFAVLLQGDAAAAEAVFGELQARFRIRQTEITSERLTFSCGSASCPLHATDAVELKKFADHALYESKNSGKDRFTVFSGFALPGDHERRELGPTDGRLRAVEKLVAVVDARDAYVGRHSAGVAQLVEAIGAHLGLEADELRRLRLAGLLHDLGKIGIPDHVLNKPAPLDAHEMAQMQKHSQIGFDLLDGLDLAPIDTWILHHHEHWDGSGYPFGLAGEEIPFGSRLILVADAFEAMTTERSYSRPISIEAAMTELRDKSGTQFDPFVIEALDAYLRDRRPPKRSSASEGLRAWSI